MVKHVCSINHMYKAYTPSKAYVQYMCMVLGLGLEFYKFSAKVEVGPTTLTTNMSTQVLEFD